ncbi:MAG: T9SS type A sorting domain-containing protein [Xanthomarina gelatinilytica]|uniref:T9SS type A sorting domain-containing protein n=1 Tax=Xanthomarina gelatinilytica TaxID=1137281 RepID=UPI003A8618DE
MKKTTYLMILFFGIYSFSFAQYTPIPDIAFEQQLINDGIDSNTTIDGQILTSEANNYSGALDIANSGISDLTGIEAFFNITSINFNYNTGITSVDLTNSPLLTSITGVGCSGLTTINIAGLVNVTELQFANASLLSLDVTTNTALETLNIRKNSVSSLDLSQNGLLTSLNAKQNALTFLDMRNGNNANVTLFNADTNQCLKCVFVDDASSTYLSGWIKDNNSNFVNSEIDCDALPPLTPSQCPTIGINEVEDVAFNMYPNPVNNTLYVRSKSNHSVVKIYNITGKVILTKTLTQGESVVNVSALSSGVYLARFISENKVDTKKLIIK